MSASARDLIANPEKAFKTAWQANGIRPIRSVKGNALTPAYNKGSLAERLAMDPEEAAEKWGTDPNSGMDYRFLAAKELKTIRSGEKAGIDVEPSNFNVKDVAQKVGGNIIDAGVAENATPLVFDPDVLQLLKQNAPLAFGRLTRRGAEGYQVVFNNVSEREAPRGYGSESDSANLQDINRDFGFETPHVDLSIYMDATAITDFSAEAAAHYMNLEELAIGSRMAEYSQLHEQTVLYGDPGTAGEAGDNETGGPGDPNAFTGLSNLYPETDLATPTDIGEAIKSEIRDLLQGDFAVNPNDLEVWTSWTVFDELENELRSDHGRFSIDVDNINLDYGNYQLEIGGVPVVPSHNVDSHTYDDPADTTYTVGDDGDVFLVNTATAEYRELLPLTTIPLAQRGASDEVGMVEFGTLIERSAEEASGGEMEDNSAQFGKYLVNAI